MKLPKQIILYEHYIANRKKWLGYDYWYPCSSQFFYWAPCISFQKRSIPTLYRWTILSSSWQFCHEVDRIGHEVDGINQFKKALHSTFHTNRFCVIMGYLHFHFTVLRKSVVYWWCDITPWYWYYIARLFCHICILVEHCISSILNWKWVGH